jgi:hypothetical protein
MELANHIASNTYILLDMPPPIYPAIRLIRVMQSGELTPEGLFALPPIQQQIQQLSGQ